MEKIEVRPLGMVLIPGDQITGCEALTAKESRTDGDGIGDKEGGEKDESAGGTKSEEPASQCEGCADKERITSEGDA